MEPLRGKRYVAMRALLILASFLFLSLSAEANEATVRAALKPAMEATLRGEFEPSLDIMYEPVLEDIGGRAKMREAVKTLKEVMAKQKLEFRKFELQEPYRFVKGEKRQYVIVPTYVEMETPDKLIKMHAFQFGVEVAPGKWRFLDGAKTDMAVVQKYFPDYPTREKLPARKQEVVPK